MEVLEGDVSGRTDDASGRCLSARVAATYSWTADLVGGDLGRELAKRAVESERAAYQKRLDHRNVKYILRTGQG